MWSVTNHTPYEADSTWGRNKEGAHEWIVVVKGTFNIETGGRLKLADQQLKPLLLPEYNGKEGLSSLRYEADLVNPKPTTDIILNGTAYAPKGRTTTGFLVSLRVGNVSKQLKVVGNRVFERGIMGIKPSSAKPVDSVPIVYERAYGGFDQSDPDPKRQRLDTRNPVGCGISELEGQPLPNFEYLNGDIEKTGPAGFGAVASYWSPRLELNGTYDEKWQKNRYPLLPADWQASSLLCSPIDQRPSKYLSGGEFFELQNLSPDGMLKFILPKISLIFKTYIDNRIEEHLGWLATIIIEPDFSRVILVWQTSLLCRMNGDYLDKTIVSEKLL